MRIFFFLNNQSKATKQMTVGEKTMPFKQEFKTDIQQTMLIVADTLYFEAS